MKDYLKEIHTKPHHHKKRFAFLVSGSTTLLIFAVWSLVRFGGEPQIARDVTSGPVQLAATIESGVIGDAWDGVKSSFSSLKNLFSDDK